MVNKDNSYPDTVDYLIVFPGGKKRAYMFHFYKNKFGRFVALCATVGCEDAFGEGSTWWSAQANCLEKLMNQGKIKL